MSQSDGSSDVVPLLSPVIHKFYEPLVLRLALNQATRQDAMGPPREEPYDSDDPEQVYQRFVYKLAHVCDNVKEGGGPSITSFVILRGTGKIVEYWFASNKRTEDELHHTAAFVQELLRKVGSAEEKQSKSDSLHDFVLRDVIWFNRRRIQTYLKSIPGHAQSCLDGCSNELAVLDEVIEKGLSDFLRSNDLNYFAKRLTYTQASRNEFLMRCGEVIHGIRKLENSQAGTLIEERSKEGRMPGHKSKECWSELQHAMNRVLAYHTSVHFILRAKKFWPELFGRFEVNFILSSAPMQKLGRNKSLFASSIINRMAREHSDNQKFSQFVETLQGFDLDHRIKLEYLKDSFRPIVHCEVLLLDWLNKNRGIDREHFFNGWMYIGSSKPTCQLCDYYFLEHRTGVGHRASHSNLYINWRFPDVLKSQGKKGVNERQMILDRILARIRKDTFDLVEKKVPSTYKRHDSNTFSARMTHQETWTADNDSVAGLDEATLRIEGLSLLEELSE